MKKLLLAIFLILLPFSAMGKTLPNPPAAPTPPLPPTPHRFAEVIAKNTTIAKFDTETFRYQKDTYRDELLLSVWIKTSPNTDGSYSLNQYLLRQNEREIMLLEQIDFNAANQVTSSRSSKYDVKAWIKVIPETDTEKWYTAALKYAKTNNGKLKAAYKRHQESK